ncbi:MAG: hypothetical protein ACREXR_11115, partial [Gammaproteobacteria bacterium]
MQDAFVHKHPDFPNRLELFEDFKLDFLWIDIFPVRQNNNVLSPPGHKKHALFIEIPQIAGMQPTVLY